MEPTHSRQHWILSVPFPEPEMQRQSPEELLWQMLEHLPSSPDTSFTSTYTSRLIDLMNATSTESDISETLFKMHQKYPVDFDSFERIEWTKPVLFHLAHLINRLPVNAKGKGAAVALFEGQMCPHLCLEGPKMALQHFAESMVNWLSLLSSATQSFDVVHDLHLISYREWKKKSPEGLAVTLFKGPWSLFQAFLEMKGSAAIAHRTELKLLNQFFRYFAASGEETFPYKDFAGCLLESAQVLLQEKDKFDLVSLVTLLSFCPGELTLQEMDLFSKLIDLSTVMSLPQCFWKSRHVESFLEVFEQKNMSIPLRAVLQLRMQKGVDQKVLERYEALAKGRELFTQMIQLSNVQKSFLFLPVLTWAAKLLEQAGANPIYLSNFRQTIRMVLKYLGHLKNEKGYRVDDLEKIKLEHLWKIVPWIRQYDCALLLPFCREPLQLHEALLEDAFFEFNGLPRIRFLNALEQNDSPRLPVEKILKDFKYYFTSPNALYELGRYESRYAGKACTKAYRHIVTLVQKILQVCPMKMANYEKASAGLLLLSRRGDRLRKL